MIKPVIYLSLISSALAQAAGLPDTGQNLCFNGSRSLVECTASIIGDSSAYPGQDGRYGRDAQARAGLLPKIGYGDAGFDYTKVCNNGQLAGQGFCPGDPPIGNAYNEWGCTLDNTTGLMWEVKIKNNRNHLRNAEWRYVWYDPNNTVNGGYSGIPDNDDTFYNFCLDTLRCDTQKYIIDINQSRLCGYADWRLPTREELQTIIHYGQSIPSVDSVYIPNLVSDYYWTHSSVANYPADAWAVDFSIGSVSAIHKSNTARIILVR